MVWRAVLRGWRHPHCWTPPIAATPTARLLAPECCPNNTTLQRPPPPPPPWLATDEQPLAEITRTYNNFNIFFHAFDKKGAIFFNFWHLFSLFTSCQTKRPENVVRGLIIIYSKMFNCHGIVFRFLKSQFYLFLNKTSMFFIIFVSFFGFCSLQNQEKISSGVWR